jgi:chlorite dismutase
MFLPRFMTDQLPAPVVPAEGWHVLHLFYKIEHGQWSLFSPDEQREAKTQLTELLAEIRATENVQLLHFAMVSPKADLGFMLLGADLHTVNAFEKKLSLALGPDVLTPTFSYLSMTERSEYTTSEEEYAVQLTQEENLQPGTSEHAVKMEAFRQRMT